MRPSSTVCLCPCPSPSTSFGGIAQVGLPVKLVHLRNWVRTQDAGACRRLATSRGSSRLLLTLSMIDCHENLFDGLTLNRATPRIGHSTNEVYIELMNRCWEWLPFLSNRTLICLLYRSWLQLFIIWLMVDSKLGLSNPTSSLYCRSAKYWFSMLRFMRAGVAEKLVLWTSLIALSEVECSANTFSNLNSNITYRMLFKF